VIIDLRTQQTAVTVRRTLQSAAQLTDCSVQCIHTRGHWPHQTTYDLHSLTPLAVYRAHQNSSPLKNFANFSRTTFFKSYFLAPTIQRPTTRHCMPRPRASRHCHKVPPVSVKLSVCLSVCLSVRLSLSLSLCVLDYSERSMGSDIA